MLLIACQDSSKKPLKGNLVFMEKLRGISFVIITLASKILDLIAILSVLMKNSEGTVITSVSALLSSSLSECEKTMVGYNS